MQNHQIDFNQLYEFSNSNPYKTIPVNSALLFEELNKLQSKYCFPSVNNDIGNFIQFFTGLTKPKVIFEMGSGYGHSAFWFLQGSCSIESIYLTEIRKDLVPEFESLPWHADWKEKIKYMQGNAFCIIDNIDKLDMALIDGGKSDYLKFLRILETKMEAGAVVLIDNSYWRGSFLDPVLSKEHQSAIKIGELHDYLAKPSSVWDALFIPYVDGLTVLRKKD